MLKLSLLGKPTVALMTETVTEADENTPLALNTNKTLALLCYLVLVREPCSRHMLAGLFWGEDSETKAKNSLRVARSNLNKLFPDHLEISRLTVAFHDASSYHLDTEEFDRRMAAVRAADGPPDVDALRVALALYRGEFLEDFYIDGAPDFEEWVLAEREYWRQLALDGFKTLSEQLMATRAYGEAIEVLQRVLVLEPWDEEAHRQLMIAHSRTGNFNAALAQYNICVEQLAAELGAPPMPETEALYARIQSARAARQHNLPEDETPLVGRAQELDQIQRALLDPSHRLVTIAGFGGQGKTRLALAAAWTANTEQAINFLHGVVFISLAGISSAETFPLALAETLDLKLTGRATPQAQIVDQLRQRELLLVLDNFEHLLDAVDLLAQIIQRCPDVKLLVTSREPLNMEGEWRIDLEGLGYPTAILSRQQDAMAYAAVQLWEQSARQVEPAYAVTDQEETVAVSRLCGMVAGSPLAIKMAARWLRLMSTGEIVAEIQQNMDMLSAEMRNWPQRQRSMRAIFDSTYASLAESEQQVFRRVSVFRGGFTTEAARAVAKASPFVLADLVDRSLLQVHKNGRDSRYDLHELTRQYAEQQLDEREAEEVRNVHSHYYASLVGAHRERIDRSQYREAIQEILANLDNIRAAWQWLVGSIRNKSANALVLEWWDGFVPTLTPVFVIQGMYLAGRQTYDAAAEAMEAAGWNQASDTPSTKPIPAGEDRRNGHRHNGKHRSGHHRNGHWGNGRAEHEHGVEEQAVMAHGELGDEHARQRTLALAQARIHLGQFCNRLGEFDRTVELADAALPYLEQQGEKAEIAYALKVLGRCNYRLGQRIEAEEQLRRSATLYRAVNDLRGVASAVILLGSLRMYVGDYGAAEEYIKEAYALDDALGYVPGQVQALCNLGASYMRQRKWDQALQLMQESLAMAEQDNITGFIMVNTSNIGHVYTGMGQYDLGEQFYQSSLQMAREIGDRRWVAANLNGLAYNYLAQHKLDLAKRCADEGLRLAYAQQNIPDALGNLAALAHVWARRGLVDDALTALLFAEHHPSIRERDQRYYAQLLQELLEELPVDIVEQVRARTKTLTMDYFLTVDL